MTKELGGEFHCIFNEGCNEGYRDSPIQSETTGMISQEDTKWTPAGPGI